MLRAYDMYECWKRLPKKTRQEFTNHIIRPMRFERDAASGVEKSVLSALKKDIKAIIDSCYLVNKLHDTELELHDFLTAGISLRGNIKLYIDEENDDFDRWRELYLILDFMLTREDDNPILRIYTHLNNMCYICTSIDSAYYWCEKSDYASTPPENYVCLVYTLRKIPAEKTYVNINGKFRPVFRLGIAGHDGVDWASIPVDTTNAGDEKPRELPVFVQTHALNRLLERLAPLEKPEIQVLLYEAFEEPRLSSGPGESHFIAFRYNNAKIGYLTYEILDTMVVVTTFLLLTQNGTFEGTMLNREYGLSKYAKQHFEIDRLHTFINTDVYQDEELKALFARCGCESLFHVWDRKTLETISFDANYAKHLKKIFFR